MSSQSNEICNACAGSYLGVNGRFCKELGHYVEYATEPPCVGKGDKK